ncbi:MAG: hypothetical protein U9P79_01895 [Candidatus Cloacimonadota bacterium]|nr:hypothetical protein [Candidatus Cloacimonadota bacterium]
MKIDKLIVRILIILVAIAFCWGCAEDDPEDNDSTPPSKIIMTPHLWDVGDINPNTGTFYVGDNGMAAVSTPNHLTYNWMKIKWDGEPLQFDGDIHHIDIFRYYLNDTTKLFVAQIQYDRDSTLFIDKFTNYNDPKIGKNWHYFIIPYDESGNFTRSDTVSYSLIEKPALSSPQTEANFSSSEEISFSWEINTPDYTFRILFFDEGHDVIFADDLIPGETTCTSTEIGMSFFPGYKYFWRIDAIHSPDGTNGSKSEERIINIF